MQPAFQDFNHHTFSFHKDPVLVIEDFWSPNERALFQDAMQRSKWKCLTAMPEDNRAFPNCGNWLMSEIGQTEASVFLKRVTLPCFADCEPTGEVSQTTLHRWLVYDKIRSLKGTFGFSIAASEL